MKNIFKNQKYPIEHLVFQIEDTSKVSEFIDLDEEVWTHELSKVDGFLSKEVWINDNVPGEVHTILIWESMDSWKSISIEELKRIDKIFNEKFSSPFKITRRIHKESNHGLYKVRLSEKG